MRASILAMDSPTWSTPTASTSWERRNVTTLAWWAPWLPSPWDRSQRTSCTVQDSISRPFTTATATCRAFPQECPTVPAGSIGNATIIMFPSIRLRPEPMPTAIIPAMATVLHTNGLWQKSVRAPVDRRRT